MPPVHSAATFADNRTRRRRLDRWWGDGPRALICGCNPSTADAEENDPTIHRTIELVRGIPGVDGFTMVNWEDRIATDPDAMRRARLLEAHDDEPGYLRRREENLTLIRQLSLLAVIRIVAWGNLVPFERQTTLVLRAMSLDDSHPLYAFALTDSGAPKHPLARGKSRIPKGAQPVLWRPAGQDPIRRTFMGDDAT